MPDMPKFDDAKMKQLLSKKLDSMHPSEIKALRDQMLALDRKQRENKIKLFTPNEAQLPIANCNKRVIDIRGGNRSGKSEIAGFIIACHLTGLYPDWWKGWRFTHPVNIAFMGPTYDEMRRSSQLKLFGEVDDIGTGFIPKECILGEPSYKAQKNGAIDVALVRHITGGTSRAIGLTFEQEIGALAGFQLDGAWLDEQGPYDKFEEIQMRMLDRGGIIVLAYCPQFGETELTKYLDNMDEKHISHFFLTTQDNPTLNNDMVDLVIDSLSDAAKEYRIYGRTNTEDGRLFTFDKGVHVCEPFEIEPYWRQVGGIDTGMGHPTAGVRLAIDDEAQTVYAIAEYMSEGQYAQVHASAFKKWGDIDLYIDTSSKRTNQVDKNNVFDYFKGEGLAIKEATKSVQVSVNIINLHLSEMRLYVFSTCRNLISQLERYRSVKSKTTGEVKIVKRDDDLVDAFRYAMMALDKARVPGVNKGRPILPKVEEWKPFDKRLGV